MFLCMVRPILPHADTCSDVMKHWFWRVIQAPIWCYLDGNCTDLWLQVPRFESSLKRVKHCFKILINILQSAHHLSCDSWRSLVSHLCSKSIGCLPWLAFFLLFARVLLKFCCKKSVNTSTQHLLSTGETRGEKLHENVETRKPPWWWQPSRRWVFRNADSRVITFTFSFLFFSWGISFVFYVTTGSHSIHRFLSGVQ